MSVYSLLICIVLYSQGAFQQFYSADLKNVCLNEKKKRKTTSIIY